MKKLIPIRNRILIKKDAIKDTTEGGIVLPECLTNEKVVRVNTGTIVAVGEGLTTQQGGFLPTEVKVGQKVIYDSSRGTCAKEFGDSLLIVNEPDIIAVIEPEEQLV